MIKKRSFKWKACLALITICTLEVTLLLFDEIKMAKTREGKNAKLTHDLGDGRCRFEDAIPPPLGLEARGVLIAAYPGAGHRKLWQFFEAFTAWSVGDDWNYTKNIANTPYVKTHYPHEEGIWSWGNDMDEVMLIVRNPRYAIPSYHTLISELGYALDYHIAYKYIANIFTQRPAVESWVKWRHTRFNEEIKLWAMYIDYWMEGGLQYWVDEDIARSGQFPFKFVPEYIKKDQFCEGYEINCKPTHTLCYETLVDPIKGPEESRRIAYALKDNSDIFVINERAWDCVYNMTMDQRANDDRQGPSRDEFKFTFSQMETMVDTLKNMLTKYSTGLFENNTMAQTLVGCFGEYIDNLEIEMEEMESTDIDPDQEEIMEAVEWFANVGQGDSKTAIEMYQKVLNILSDFQNRRN